MPLDRTALDAGHRRVQLPPYPYRRRRYWPEPDARGLLHHIGWRPAPLTGDGLPGPVLVTGADPVAVRRLVDGFAAVGVRAGTADDGEVRPQTVLLLGGPARPHPAEGLEGDLRQAVTAVQDALTLLDRSGARRLLVVTEDAHVTGHGVEHAVPGRAVLGGLALAVPEESAGVVANWVDLSSHDSPGLPDSPGDEGRLRIWSPS
ncbi:hypothetical protein ACR6C2_44515 [Streptomyces sp. INA 01156]